jgi:hypothetical protein
MPSSNRKYDSVYGINDGYPIHIVYKNDKSYPRYIVKFKDLESKN